MKTKLNKKKLRVEFSEMFTADTVEIIEPGSFTKHTRQQVEGWLAGMDAAKHMGDEEACREAVAETINGNRARQSSSSALPKVAAQPSGSTTGIGEPGKHRSLTVAAQPEQSTAFQSRAREQAVCRKGIGEPEKNRSLTSLRPATARHAVAAQSGGSVTGSQSGRKGTSALPKVAAQPGGSTTGMRGSEKNRSLTVAALLIAVVWMIGGRTAWCQEITPGFSFQDGQQLYASQLQQLVGDATITPVFYNNAQTTPILGSGYYFLILNPANQTYYRINAQQVLYGNTNIFLNAPAEAVPAYGLLLFCDPTNGWVASTTVSNLLWNSASNIDVAGLSFANTNNGGATNAYVLARWPYPVFSGLPPGGTNYPAHFIVFDTNGVPYRMSLTNAEAAFASDLGTVMSLPYEYEQEFAPWRLYGTNTVAPYTNAFGWTTNFPITAYFQTNNGNTLTNATLTDTDTVPINSFQLGVPGSGAPTNTSATLLSIYEYMTNKNALPPYTLARSQFFGPCASWNVTNMSAASGIITNYALAVNFSNPVPVSFAFDQPGVFGQGLGNPYTPNLASNTLYWAQVTNQAVLSFQIFTNFANAQARLNPVLGLSGYISSYATLLWLTNYTSVNCSVIQACDALTIEPGVYDVFFSTASQTPYYYLTGSCQGQSFNWGTSVNFVNFPNCIPPGWPGVYNTNGFEFQTVVNGAQDPMPLVQILIQPE